MKKPEPVYRLLDNYSIESNLLKHTLFVSSSRLGDAVLTTGVLDHLLKTEPESRVTVICGEIPKSIFEGIDGVDQVITVKKRRFGLHWPLLITKLGFPWWHRIVDFRASLLGFLPARHRHIWRKRDDKTHKTRVNAELIGLNRPLKPVIAIREELLDRAKKLLNNQDGLFLAIAPTTAGPGKLWHIENYITLTKRLLKSEGPLANTRVILLGGPGEEEQVRPFLEAFDAGDVIDLVGKTTPLEAAHVISLCRLFIGNDSGLMHCATAVSTPTVGLFGVGKPLVYGPWGDKSLIILSDPVGTAINRLTRVENNRTEIIREALSTDKVYNEIAAFTKTLDDF